MVNGQNTKKMERLMVTLISQKLIELETTRKFPNIRKRKRKNCKQTYLKIHDDFFAVTQERVYAGFLVNNQLSANP